MLILVDKPMAELAFRTATRAESTESTTEIVLIQDGVLLDPPDIDTGVYAVARDVEIRGANPPDGVELIDYDELVEKMFEQEVKSFV